MSETGIVKQMPGQVVRAQAWELNEQQEQLVRDTYFNGADETEIRPLLEISKARRLNPFLKQIHFVKRWDSNKRREVWSAQVGIDGFRVIAERTGKYDGQDEPEYEYNKDGSLKLCRVRVYRKDWSRPAVGMAHWDEYCQYTRDGKITAMWQRGKHFMLAKCAEAVAMRKAFPEDTSGLYVPEEMGSDDSDDAGTAPPEKRTETVKRQLANRKPPMRAQQREQAQEEEETEAPPSDDDAPPPHDALTGDIVEPEQTPSEPVVPYGKYQGKPVSELTDGQLEWFGVNARSKEFVRAVRAEISKRVGEPPMKEARQK